MDHCGAPLPKEEAFCMNVENRIYPEPDQVAALQEPGPDGPIVMVNLLKFRGKALYPDGRDPDLPGREAYHRYGIAVAKLVEGVGGRVLFVGKVTFLSLGRAEELWDEVALAEYPNRAALVKMATSAAYEEIAVHREAGLAGQLNIETVPTLAALLGTR
jgi:uncharacterized protein (DUF1330 family)